MKKELYAIPAPLHPDGLIYIQSNGYQEEHCVLVDAEKFITAWKEQNQKYCAHPSIKSTFLRKALGLGALDQQLLNLLKSTTAESIKYLPKQTAWGNNTEKYPMEAARISYNKGKIDFSNGRHRAVNLFNVGAKYIPVDVFSGSGFEEFKQHFSIC